MQNLNSSIENLINIQNFLNKYKKSNPSFNVKSNDKVFVSDNQLPDLWLRTRIVFDKNRAFVFSKKTLNRVTKPNLFPR
jgi:hypothetical protein